MKTSTLLMMAAAALPAWGQVAVPAVVPTPDTAMLLSLPAVVEMSAEQRAAALSAAALLPADTDSFIAFSNLGKLIRQLGNPSDPYLAMLSGLDGLAIGISAEGVQVMRELLPLLQSDASGEIQQVAEAWEQVADPAVAGVIKAQRELQQANAEAAMTSALEKLRVAPVYLTATVTPETAGMLQMMVAFGMGQLMQNSPGGLVQHNGMQGVMLSSMIPTPSGNREMEVYLMYKLDGNKLSVVLCADPAQAVLPASPAESVLAKADLLNSRINDKTMVVASLSPALQEVNTASSLTTIESFGALVSGVFRNLAKTSPAFGRPGVAAADGVEFLLSQLKEFTPLSDSPDQLYVWVDDNVHIELVQDADGATFGPAVMKQPTLLSNPDVAFCVETAPGQGRPEVDVPGIMGALESIFAGYIKTLNAPEQEKATRTFDRCLSYRGDIDAADRALTTIAGALSGSSTLVVTVPAGSQEVNIAAYSPVSNRSALTDGWCRLMSIVEQVRAKSDCDKQCELPPVVTTETAGATAYTLQMPTECKCPMLPRTPGALVSDSALVVGTSAELNSSLAASATGTMPLPGCVAQWRPEPTARIFDRFAAAAAACGKEQKAAELREAANIFRVADGYVERVVSGSIIVNDRLYTRVDAILRK